MAKIQFKGKATKLWISDDQFIMEVKIPKLTRNHCDMSAFRDHGKYRSYANSVLFEGMINGEIKKLYPAGYVRLNKLTDNTTISEGYLTQVTIEI